MRATVLRRRPLGSEDVGVVFYFLLYFFHQSLQVRNNEVGRVIKLVGGKDIRVFCTRA